MNIYTITAIFPLKNTLELRDNRGNIFYWKKLVSSKLGIRMYSVGDSFTWIDKGA